ncbi:hypothetical protein [Mucilaginibacter psychrotolerans]|uniref:Uncharacterized protein n=1 Tax=Mucilaginibacter psychrotolerans TaxID=1524096 RepID=A0A4Y8S364_9SPHI|nr:hypothetical protein [Mucilaginibacter psychrotolerans]TFF33439.1 hypothetical protein E2R66_25860 [Mucilaginibacter psychrotolerans]
MKFKHLLTCLALAAILPILSFKNKIEKAGDKGTYGFVYVSGVYPESHTALISQIIYQPPYPECKEESRFWGNAEAGFAKYLAAYNNEEKFGGRNNVASTKGLYSKSFLTHQEAQDAMDEKIANEKQQGHHVKMIPYSYICQ